jgi:hypothetical protein
MSGKLYYDHIGALNAEENDVPVQQVHNTNGAVLQYQLPSPPCSSWKLHYFGACRIFLDVIIDQTP